MDSHSVKSPLQQPYAVTVLTTVKSAPNQNFLMIVNDNNIDNNNNDDDDIYNHNNNNKSKKNLDWRVSFMLPRVLRQMSHDLAWLT